MANLPKDKTQANFAMDAELIADIKTATEMHRRIDGSRTFRPSEYVEDLIRRDFIAKKLIVLPALRMTHSEPLLSTDPPVSKAAAKKATPKRKTTSRKKKA